jgi:dTDP-4-dehydrorhamnose reductase
MNSHYFVLGKNGQLGRWLTRLVADGEGCALSAAFAHADLDLADRDAVMGLESDCAGDQVDWLLNAAAYTAVDLCETETSACNATNADGPGHLADWCREQKVSLVHVSTDYVFAGDASEPYRESDPTSPQTAYGRSKLEGEVQVLERLPSAWVVRTSWVFGPGKNFVGAIVRQGVLRKTGKLDGPLRVVDDQLGCPTYAKDLAAGILELTQLQGVEPGGVIHLSNTEPCTWWDFARAILDGVGYRDLEIERVATSEFVTPAARPAYSVLDGSKARGLGISLRSWRDALDDYLASDDFAALHQNLQTEAQAAP